MEKSKQKTVQDAAQTNYRKILRDFRDRITSDYRTVIGKEYQGVILGYD